MIESKTNLVHHFITSDAKLYGVHEAIFLYNIRHWVRHNQANKTNYHEGRYWTYNSRRAFADILDYFTEQQIRTIFKNLTKCGILLVGNFNEVKYDRTMWYSINEEWTKENAPSDKTVQSICSKKQEKQDTLCSNDHFHLFDSTNEFGQNDKPIPDINTNIINTNKKLEYIYFKGDTPLTGESASPDLLPIKSKPKSPNKEAQKVLELWNEIAKEKGQLSKAICLDDKRTRQIIKASSELFKSLEEWRAYFYSIYTSDFLLGHSGKSWRASFDWVINSTNAIKVLEGKYFNKAQSGITASGMSVEDVTRITREIFGSN